MRQNHQIAKLYRIIPLAAALISSCSTSHEGEKATAKSSTTSGQDATGKPATAGGLSLTMPAQLSGTPAATLLVNLVSTDCDGGCADATPAIITTAPASASGTAIALPAPLDPCQASFATPVSGSTTSSGAPTPTIGYLGTCPCGVSPIAPNNGGDTNFADSTSASTSSSAATGIILGNGTGSTSVGNATPGYINPCAPSPAQPTTPVVPGPGPAQFATWSYPFVAGQAISIPNVAPGDYTVYISMVDAQGNVLEQGSSPATIVAGQTAQINVTLHAVSDGGLDIGITTDPNPNPQPIPGSTCGQPPGPNYLCGDNITVAGPGTCVLAADGSYSWTQVSCPVQTCSVETTCSANGYACLPINGLTIPVSSALGICQSSLNPILSGVATGSSTGSASYAASTSSN